MSANHSHIIHPNYRPDIDGLRAVAILAVIFYHGFPNLMKGGFIGVDVFFVISGFLISTIIFSSLEHSRFSYFDFYVRRIRRIFPALIAILLFCIAFGWLILFSDESVPLGKHIIGGILFASNFLYWRESGYFDTQSESKVLLHLWSLAVEEQFYIFWPLILAYVWRKKIGFLKLTIAIALISFAANIYLMRLHPVAAFFLPISRFWELMIGGLLAYVKLHRPLATNSFSNVQSSLGFALLLFGLFHINRFIGFPGYWALVPTFGTALIISAGPDAFLNRNVLSNSLMVWIGLISYPLYLWHWPLLSFSYIINNKQPVAEITIIVLLCAVLFAWGTYQFIELPIRNGKWKYHSAKWLVAIMTVILAVGGAIKYGLIHQRIDNPSLQNIIDARNDWNDEAKGFSKFHYDHEIFRQAKLGKRESIAFVGDSHILQYMPRVSYLLSEYPGNINNIYFAVHEGCIPIPGVFKGDVNPSIAVCKNYLNSINRFLDRKDIKTVIIGACWSCYLLPHDDNKNNAEDFSEPESRNRAISLLGDYLKKLIKSKDVYLVIDNPIGNSFNPNTYLRGNRYTSLTVANIPSQVSATQDQFDLRTDLKLVAKLSGVKVIDPYNSLCNDKHFCISTDDDGQPIYKDGNHLRARFVMQHANYIDAALLSFR